MKALVAFAAFALAALRGSHAASVQIENGVYVAEESTFDTLITKYPVVMVKFYAPWCGHCKAMKADYEKAARKLKKMAEGSADQVPRLAKVDATKETGLASKFGVQGFPHLIVFKNGEKFDDYRGGRDKDDIVNYMSAFASPDPVGMLLRVYYLAKSPYKELIRQIPFIPPQFRKYAFMAFPLALAYPFFLIALLMCCCGGSKGSKKKQRQAAKAPAKRSDRTASPAKKKEKDDKDDDSKGDDSNAKDDAKKEPKAAEDNEGDEGEEEKEPKDEQEKKDD